MAQQKTDSLRQSKDRPLQLIEMKPSVRMLPAMPITVIYDPMRVVVSFEKAGDDVLFRFRFAATGPGYVENLIDAYQLRETFLDVRTPGEALDLLNIVGHFLHLREREEEQLHESLTWSDFQKWQELIRIILRDGPIQLKEVSRTKKEVKVEYVVPDHLRSLLRGLSHTETSWLQGYPDQIVIGSDFPHPNTGERKRLTVEIMVHSALEAILATAYVDGLSGVNYQLCALLDCSRVYEINSRHERQYCSQACAHKASVRRRRAQAKLIAKSAMNKPRKKRAEKPKGA